MQKNRGAPRSDHEVWFVPFFKERKQTKKSPQWTPMKYPPSSDPNAILVNLGTRTNLFPKRFCAILVLASFLILGVIEYLVQ